MIAFPEFGDPFFPSKQPFPSPPSLDKVLPPFFDVFWISEQHFFLRGFYILFRNSLFFFEQLVFAVRLSPPREVWYGFFAPSPKKSLSSPLFFVRNFLNEDGSLFPFSLSFRKINSFVGVSRAPPFSLREERFAGRKQSCSFFRA